MEIESWVILAACTLLTSFLLWKLYSAHKRINELRNSTYVALNQDSSISRQLDETSKQLAEKDRYISHLAENLSALNDAWITNKRVDEENIALKNDLTAEREQVKAFQDKESEHEKQLFQAQTEVTYWRNEAHETFKRSAEFLKMKGEIAELKKRCEAAELKVTEVAAIKQNLTKDIEALREQHQSTEQKNKEFTEVLRSRCSNAEKINAELSAKNEELRQEWSNNFSEYKRKADQWKHDLDIMTERIAVMRKDVSENEQLKAQLQLLLQRNSNLEALSTMVKKQLNDSTKRTRELEMKLKTEVQQRPPLASSDMECVICIAEKKCVLLRPCMHACVCEQCSQHINRCPLCTVGLTGRERIFL